VAGANGILESAAHFSGVSMTEPLFWADQKAREICERKKYHFVDKPVPKRTCFVVKTSASLSGVLHIGRLSDTIRADSIVTALRDAGAKARMIWVGEDMDPLRSIPEGVPKEYEEYLGKPVTEVPDPSGCHDSYAEHHRAEYLEVMEDFVVNKARRYSTTQEYDRGSFRRYIKKLLDNRDRVREILEKYRDSSLSSGWTPWKPICAECGKVITPQVLEIDGSRIRYECRDYQFEKTVAKGCGYVGWADALRDKGKILWKGEWASEWALWKVSCEGGGKEYEVPTSAWWVNGEIAERIFDYPMPTPFFYEHLLIDGRKMSASLGNVVYPADWLKVAPAELLRFLYNKKLMKTRSFSWRELPRLYADYDGHADVYYGKADASNERERSHMIRLYRISQLRSPPKERPATIDLTLASLIAQVYDPEESMSEAIKALRRTELIKGRPSKRAVEQIRQRLIYARNWVRMFVPELALRPAGEPDRAFIAKLTDPEKASLRHLARVIKTSPGPDAIQSSVFSAAELHGVSPSRLFQILYRLLLGTDHGPRMGPLVCALGPDTVADRLEKALG